MQLQVNQLGMAFRNKKVLDDITFSVEEGGLIGLIGPNGAGKSTLMKNIVTLLKPTTGDITLDGKSIVSSPKIMQKQLGYMPQHIPFVPQLSAVDYLRYLSALKGLPKQESEQQIQQLLERLHLRDAQDKALGDFSGGMRQRVGLAAALLGNPRIIIVDEPSVGLDPIERIGIRNLLSELAQDRIVILSTHIVSDIEAVASQLILLREGKLVFQGTPDKLIEEAQDKVWEYIIPVGQLPENEDEVSELRQGKDGVHVRVISKQQPTPESVVVAPSLEDACLTFLGGE